MKEDRELLEFAAKAAEINGHYVKDDDWYGAGILFTDEYDCNQAWNPLTDDGDALRLAVSLRLVNELQTLVEKYNSEEDYDADPYAATRRAIVRAAAEIGKAMK